MSATPIRSHETRGDLRLRLAAERPGEQCLDGAWWPYTRDLIGEIPDLVRGFPAQYGRITQASYSPPDWDTSPRRVDLGTKVLAMGSFPEDDTHVVVVGTPRRERLTLLVVPPGFTAAQGEQALDAASAADNAHSGSEVLGELIGDHRAEPADRRA